MPQDNVFDIVVNSWNYMNCIVYNPTDEDVRCYKHRSFAEKKLSQLNKDWETIHTNGFRIKSLRKNNHIIEKRIKADTFCHVLSNYQSIEYAIKKALLLVSEAKENDDV